MAIDFDSELKTAMTSSALVFSDVLLVHLMGNPSVLFVLVNPFRRESDA